MRCRTELSTMPSKSYNLNPIRGCVTKQTVSWAATVWSKTMYVKLLQRFGLDTGRG